MRTVVGVALERWNREVTTIEEVQAMLSGLVNFSCPHVVTWSKRGETIDIHVVIPHAKL